MCPNLKSRKSRALEPKLSSGFGWTLCGRSERNRGSNLTTKVQGSNWKTLSLRTQSPPAERRQSKDTRKIKAIAPRMVITLSKKKVQERKIWSSRCLQTVPAGRMMHQTVVMHLILKILPKTHWVPGQSVFSWCSQSLFFWTRDIG